jgi:hypothetical protein
LRRWYCITVGEYVAAFFLKTLSISDRVFCFISI